MLPRHLFKSSLIFLAQPPKKSLLESYRLEMGGRGPLGPSPATVHCSAPALVLGANRVTEEDSGLVGPAPMDLQ